MHIVMTGFGYVVTNAYQLTCRTDMLKDYIGYEPILAPKSYYQIFGK